MADVAPAFPGLDVAYYDDQSRGAKRRKVRKGTQSCWECKRRKAKCSLALSGTGDVCDGCRRRGTRCIGQEFQDDPASNRQQLGDRLGRVEELVVQLSKGSNGRHGSSNERSESTSVVNGFGVTPHRDAQTSEESEDSVTLNWKGQSKAPTSRSPHIIPTPSLNGSRHSKFIELSSNLLTAWPTPEDLEAIVSAPMGTAGVFHGMICIPYSFVMNQPLPTPRELLQLPSPGAHPVLIARKLLTLAIFLQSFSPPASEYVADRLSMDYRDIMSFAFETAIRLVTNNDELVGTVEGVECIMMECLYQNNAGYLRLAYLAIRRSLVTAQMIGLDRGSSSALLRILDLETRSRVRPDYMWFRIVQSDRYLSLQLGLPQGTIEDTFAAPDVSAEHSAIEQLERGLTIAAGRIIQRNSTGMHDLKATQEVDQLLLSGANSMPPQWWLCPDITTPCQDQLTTLRETNRFMSQLAHYHMLERLHLPFLLRQSSDHGYDYNKITAVTASREVLSRFVIFRSALPASGTFCRGVDFLAFSASTVICLGHIDARLHHDSQQTDGGRANSTLFNYLAHHRLSDRGMMERTLASLEQVVDDMPADPIAAKISRGMRYLLAIEADVANGKAYKAESDYRDNEERDEVGCDSQLNDKGDVLQVHIPHLGTIKIEPHSVTNSLQGTPVAAPRSMMPAAADFNAGAASINGLLQLPDTVPQAIGLGTDEYPIDPWVLGHDGSFTFGYDEAQDGQWAMAGFDPGDDWILQGVDTAFFDSLYLRHNDG